MHEPPLVSNGPKEINLVSVALFLLIAIGLYTLVVAYPFFSKKLELESLVKEISYSVKKTTPEQAQKVIIDASMRELGIQLKPEDVLVEKFEGYVRIIVIYKPTMVFFNHYPYTHRFKIKQNTPTYD